MERQGQARLPVHLTQRPSQKNTQLSTILLFLLSKQLRNRLAESHTDTLYKAASLRTAARHARKRGLTQGQQLRRCRPNNSPSVYVSDMGASAMTTNIMLGKQFWYGPRPGSRDVTLYSLLKGKHTFINDWLNHDLS